MKDDLHPQIMCLNHGFVRLIDSMGGDLSVVRNARNSHDASWRTGSDTGSDQRLIHYLWKNKHTTPFEAVQFTFEIKCPIFVARQWHRHRTWAYNEVSARYTELPEEFFLPEPDTIGSQAITNRQGRELSSTLTESELKARQNQIDWWKIWNEDAFDHYKQALEWGWSRELARTILPVGTYTKFFGCVSLLNLFRFAMLRSDPHAQHEIRVYSDAIKELIRPIVPVCIGAFEQDPADKA